MHGFSEHVPGGPGQSSQEIRDGKSYFYNQCKLNGKEKKACVYVQCAACNQNVIAPSELETRTHYQIFFFYSCFFLPLIFSFL